MIGRANILNNVSGGGGVIVDIKKDIDLPIKVDFIPTFVGINDKTYSG